MICPGCGKEIKDDSALCQFCGYVFDQERAEIEYQKAMEEYNRKMAEYLSQMESQQPYGQPSQNRQTNNQQPYGQPPQNRQTNNQQSYGQPPQNRQTNNQQSYGQSADRQPMQYGKPAVKKKKIAPLICCIFAIILAIGLMVSIVIYIDKDKKNNKDSKKDQVVQEVYDDDYTVLVYMVGSNLESGNISDTLGWNINFGDGGGATYSLDQMVEAKVGDNVNIVLETGGTDSWANDYGMEGKKVQRFTLENQQYNLQETLEGEVCMGEKKTLEDFINWGKKNYPANHYILVMWDHGCGATTASFGYDSYTEHDHYLEISDMKTAITNSDTNMDMIYFDACLMGTLETAASLSDCADYIYGSEDVIYTFGTNYTSWFTEISENPDITMEDLGTLMCDDFEEQYDIQNETYQSYYPDETDSYYTYEMSLIDTEKAKTVVDSLGKMMANADEDIKDFELTDFLEARNSCGSFSGAQQIDIVEFCDKYNPEGANQVISDTKACVVYHVTNMSYGNGLAFYCPAGDETGIGLYSSAGRTNLENISFHEDCITFYDDALSAYAGYAYSDDISALGMDSYYNEELVATYEDTYVGYADNSDIDLDYVYDENTGEYYLDFGDTADNISFIEQRVGYDYEEGTAVVLGSDLNVLEWDSETRVNVSFPEKWLSIDGQIVCYVVTDHGIDENGDMTMTGVVPFVICDNDDEEYYENLYGLIIQWDKDNGACLKGYAELDIDTLAFKDSYVYSLNEGMNMRFAYGLVSHDGNKLDESSYSFATLGDTHTCPKEGLEISYSKIDEFETMLKKEVETKIQGYAYVKVTDVFGDEYSTDLVPQK